MLIVLLSRAIASDPISMTIRFHCYTPCAATKLNRTGNMRGRRGGGETPPRRIRISMNYLCRMEAGSSQNKVFLFSCRYLP